MKVLNYGVPAYPVVGSQDSEGQAVPKEVTQLHLKQVIENGSQEKEMDRHWTLPQAERFQ